MGKLLTSWNFGKSSKCKIRFTDFEKEHYNEILNCAEDARNNLDIWEKYSISMNVLVIEKQEEN